MFRSIFKRPQEIVIACSSDESYACGLAVTIRTLLDHLHQDRRVRLYVLGPLSDETKHKLLNSWQDQRLSTQFICPDESLFTGLQCNRHAHPAVYYRILLPQLLTSRSRVLYLDSDLIVKDDIAKLWDISLEGYPLAAVQDTGIQIVGNPQWGLPNYAEIGLAPETPYCNTGVMLLDLKKWRKEHLSARILAYLKAHHTIIRFWDQDAINAIIGGRWLMLPPEWNVGHESLLAKGVSPETHERIMQTIDLVDRQKIVHFLLKKPWHPDCPHPRVSEFQDIRARTAFADITTMQSPAHAL